MLTGTDDTTDPEPPVEDVGIVALASSGWRTRGRRRGAAIG